MPGQVPARSSAKAAATKAQPNKGTSAAKPAPANQLQRRTAAAISQAVAKAGQGGSKRR